MEYKQQLHDILNRLHFASALLEDAANLGKGFERLYEIGGIDEAITILSEIMFALEYRLDVGAFANNCVNIAARLPGVYKDQDVDEISSILEDLRIKFAMEPRKVAAEYLGSTKYVPLSSLPMEVIERTAALLKAIDEKISNK